MISSSTSLSSPEVTGNYSYIVSQTPQKEKKKKDMNVLEFVVNCWLL